MFLGVYQPQNTVPTMQNDKASVFQAGSAKPYPQSFSEFNNFCMFAGFGPTVRHYLQRQQPLTFNPTHASNHRCELFGSFGVFVQLMLGFLSFAVLIYKRYHEYPKRPWKIWFLDTWKQIASQLLAHFLNVAISLKLSKKQTHQQCMWYFATIVLDTTVGMLICVGILTLLERFVLRGTLQKYKSGNYYESVMTSDSNLTNNSNSLVRSGIKVTCSRRKFTINYSVYFIQFIIWNAIVLCTKSILYLLQDQLSNIIIVICKLLMGWLAHYPKLQLVIVMFIVPLVLNAVAFWIQDNYLKKKSQLQQEEEHSPKYSNDCPH